MPPSGVGLPFTLASAGLSAASTIGGAVLNTATQGISFLFTQFSNGVNGLVSLTANGFSLIKSAATGAFGTVLGVVGDILNEAKEVARVTRQLSFNTGVSQGQANRITNVFGGAGISTQAIGGAFSSPQAAISIGMRARILGLPDPTVDPEKFLTNGAQLYQRAQGQGIMGAMTLNALAGPQLMGLAGNAWSLGPERLQQNIAMSRAFQLPAGTGKLGGDIEMAENIIANFGRSTKLVLAETLLPLAPMLTRVFSWVIQHKEGIGEAVQYAGNMLFIEAPKAILRFGVFTLRALGTVMGPISDYLSGTFQIVANGILQSLPGVLQGVQTFLEGMVQVGSGIVGAATAVAQAGANFANSPIGQGIIGTASNAMGIAPPSPSPTPPQTQTAAAFSPNNPSFAPFPTTTNGGSSGPTYYSVKVPNPNAQQINPNATTGNAMGGFWVRAAGAFKGAVQYGGTGAAAGAAVGAGVGLAGGATAGAIAGAAAGGVGAIPGALAGATIFTPIGAKIGGFIGGLGGALYGVYRGYNDARNVQNSAQATFNPAAAAANGIIPPTTPNPNPPAPNSVGSLFPQPGRSVGSAFQAGQGFAQGLVPQFDLTAQRQNIENIVKGIAKGADTAGKFAKEKNADVFGAADSLEKLMNSWGRMDDNLAKIAENTSRAPQQMASLINAASNRAISRTASYIAEDYSANLGRI